MISTKRSWIPFATVLVFTVGVLVGGGVFIAKQAMVDGSLPEPREANNPVTTELPEKYPRGEQMGPDFALVDQHGQTIKLASLRGQPVFVAFAFAHCTTMCPGVIQTVKSANAELGAEKPVTLFVTLDPDRDKPETLAETAGKWEFTDGMHFLSGAPAAVNAVLDSYKIPRSTDTTSSEIVHPALVYVLDRDGKIAYSFSNPTKRWLVDAVQRIAGSSIN